MPKITATVTSLDPLEILSIVRLKWENDLKNTINTHLWVFDLSQWVANRISKLIGRKNVGDCHTLWWFLSIGSAYKMKWPPETDLLEKHGLNVIWSLSLNEVVPKKLDYSHYHCRDIEQNAQCTIIVNTEDWLRNGDLLIKKCYTGITHSMIYLWKDDSSWPIFMSRIWVNWSLSIHTLGEIMSYYKPGNYTIYRASNSEGNNRYITKFPLPKGSYIRRGHKFNN